MRRKEIAPGLILQQTDEVFGLIADTGEIKGAFSLNTLSGLVHHAFPKWAAQRLKEASATATISTDGEHKK